MKYFFYIIIFTLFITSKIGYSQFGYFYLNSGFAFPVFKGEINEFYNHNMSGNNEFIDSKYPLSLGKGTNFSFGLNSILDNNVGFDLNVEYLMESQYKFYQETTIISVKKTTNTILSSKRWSITPSFLMHAGNDDVKVVLKIGLMLGFPDISYSNVINIDTLDIEESWDYKTPMSLGISTSLSGIYKIKKKYILGVNFSFSNIACSPKSAKLVFATKNGENVLRSYKTYYSNKLYVDEVNLEYNTNPDINKPQELLKDYFPFSNLSISISLGYLIWDE